MSTLKIGDKAPLFTAPNQAGKTIALSDYLGKKVILYFYPKDNTPGCTTEACNYKDNYQSLVKQGFEVLGISSDGVKSHDKFAQKFELPFSLISDEDKNIHEKYGTWVEKSMYGKTYMGTARHTFVIDEQGVIIHKIEKVDNKNASQQVLDLF